MLDSESELLTAIQSAAKSVNKVVSAGKSISKSLERFDSAKAFERQDYIADLIDCFKTNDLAPFGCAESQKLIVTALEKKLHELRQNAHHALVSGLVSRIEKQEHFRILSDIPLVIYLHPLTLEVQFEQMKSSWTYAHETLQTVSLDPDEILASHKSLLDTFRASRIDSQSFWSIFKTAYEMVLLKNGQPAGSRIDIVETLTPLAWLWPNAAALKKNGAFPKYLLAYQLQKMRADGLLQNHGLRLELGTATGGSTRNKANVLFVPSGPSEGQYYLSICMR